jgi:hypothetical protein
MDYGIAPLLRAHVPLTPKVISSYTPHFTKTIHPSRSAERLDLSDST